jgi:pimeloyl-ACP methyl ester carboxylesterase
VLAATDPGGPHAVLPTEPLAVKLLSDVNASTSLLVKAIFPATAAGRAAGRAYVGRVGTWPGLDADSFTTATATVRAQIRAEGPLWYCRTCGAYRRLPSIRTPTLVTDGSLDIIEPPPNSRILARRIPGAKLRFFAGAGHAHLFQFNARYAGLVNGFLAAP